MSTRPRPRESAPAAPGAAPGHRPPTRLDLGLDGLGFALGLAFAWWHGWRVAELLWSLWLSSLVFGGTWLVRSVLRARPRDADTSLASLRAMQASLLLFEEDQAGAHHHAVLDLDRCARLCSRPSAATATSPGRGPRLGFEPTMRPTLRPSYAYSH